MPAIQSSQALLNMHSQDPYIVCWIAHLFIQVSIFTKEVKSVNLANVLKRLLEILLLLEADSYG